MAKSLRSKWRRKCRAVKRIRYGQKELERLKKTLGITDGPGGSNEVNMTEISEIATVTDAKAIKEQQADPDVMDVDAIKKLYSAKTLRDKNGAYPVWVHPRKIVKKSKSKNKKKKKVVKGKGKK